MDDLKPTYESPKTQARFLSMTARVEFNSLGSPELRISVHSLSGGVVRVRSLDTTGPHDPAEQGAS